MKNIIRYLDKNLERIICIVTFSAFVVLVFLQVIFRFILNFSLSWTEELARYTFIYMVYAAVSLATLDGNHVRVEIIDSIVPAKYMKYVFVLTDLICAAFMALIGYYSISYAQTLLRMNQITPALQLPYGAVYCIVPVGMFLTALRYIQRIVRRLTGKLEVK